MTLLQAIEQANIAAEIRTFRFANIREFQAFMDTFNELEYPCHVVVPFTNNGVWLNGRRKAVVPLQGWVLTRIEEDTSNFRSREVEERYLEPMRMMCKQFLYELINSDIIDAEVNEITDTIRPEYAFLTANLFGVSYQVNIPIAECAT